MDLNPQQQEILNNLGLNPPKVEQINTKPNLIPLFSISGLTLLSIGGLILLKSKNSAALPSSPSLPSTNSQNQPEPTQVPKSIQHYLLASQQYFTQALQAQSAKSDNQTITNYLNESILAASEAIKLSPSDYRGFEQRAKIYQSLLDSQPQLLAAAISDYQQAQQLNQNSPDLTRQLASLYAKNGDLQNTLTYLSATVSLEPTKAQNFYDLAKIQQQAGLLPAALDTYNRLLPLISDPSQKTQVETEKQSLEKIVAQNSFSTPTTPPVISPQPSITTEGNLLQASNNTGLIIAAPETSPDISLKNQTDSNSLSGSATLPLGQKEIVIKNSQLKPSSQIYLTIISGGKNESLELLSKSTDSFTAGFQSPLNEEVTFKWWIVNP